MTTESTTKKSTAPKAAKTKASAAKSGAWDVHSVNGKVVGKTDLPASVFGADVDAAAVHAIVRWQLAKRRAGTHQALSRSMMEASGKKPFKQKGTGRARAGSSVSPLWIGGAVVHGPNTRSYEFKAPKNLRRRALASVLSDRATAEDAKLLVVDAFAFETGKTAEVAKALTTLGLQDARRIVAIDTEFSAETLRATKNLKHVLPLTVGATNVYDLMRSTQIIVTERAVKALEERISKEKE